MLVFHAGRGDLFAAFRLGKNGFIDLDIGQEHFKALKRYGARSKQSRIFCAKRYDRRFNAEFTVVPENNGVYFPV